MPLALLAVSILCMSQPANLIRAARAPVEVLGLWRLLGAVVVLAPAAWAGRRGWAALDAGQRALTALAGALFFLHLWTFVVAAERTTIARCMIAFSTHPLWTGAGAWLLHDEKPSRLLLAAWALAAAGIALLFWEGAAGGSLAGDAAGLASAACFSAYALAGRRARRSLDTSAFVAAAYAVAAALFFAAGTLRGAAWTGYPSSTWAAISGLTFVVTLGGHALFTRLLTELDLQLMSCAKLLEPPLASVGAWLAFGERPTQRTVWAFALVAAAVLVLLAPSRAKRRTAL